MYVVPFSHSGGAVVRHGGVAAVCDAHAAGSGRPRRHEQDRVAVRDSAWLQRARPQSVLARAHGGGMRFTIHVYSNTRIYNIHLLEHAQELSQKSCL